MRNLRTAVVVLALPAFTYAQTMTFASQERSPNLVTVSTVAAPKGGKEETPEQARKLVMSLLNNFRGFAVNTDEIRKGDSELDEPSMSEKKNNYAEYLQKMERLLTKNLKALETDAINDAQQMAEKSKILSALNILKSANCLVEKKDGQFARQKDLDGNDIVAFALDQLRTNARYGMVENFKEGFARIKKDQVFGFLNYCGDEVVPCQYQNAQAFNNGRALVKKLDWFFIDAQGNESETLANVVDARALIQGISIAKFANGKFAFIDNRYDVTNLPTSAAYDDIVPFSNLNIYRIKLGNKYGLMNLDGKVLLEPVYELIEPSGVDNLYRITQNGKVGLMDSEWKIKFQPNFERIENFDNYGLAIAHEGALVRLINKNNFQSSSLYKSIGSFNKYGLAQIQNDAGLFGLINNNLKVVLEPLYTSIGDFNALNLAPACRQSEKCGFIDTEGKEIITPLFAELGEFNPYGLVVVRENVKDINNKIVKTDWVFNNKGKAILARPEGADIKTMKIRYELRDTLHSDRFIGIKTSVDNEYTGFHLVDAQTFRLITAEPYFAITPIDFNGMMRMQVGNLWGLLDSTGKVVLKPTYSEIKKPTEGYYAIKNDKDLYGFMDKKAKVQIPFEYDDVRSFRKGHCIVSKGKNKFGLINKFNAKIVPCYFQEVTVSDTSYEMIDKQGTKYTIDDKGDCLQNCPKFEEIRRKANQ
ncbi:MAG: WG repeat-containing protein [Saprospiraceae bacterium]|nr:WG repeat-containing protein [Saprospiraceae bacterium]